jgi:cell division protein FtsQ
MSQRASQDRKRPDWWKAAFIGLAAVALIGGVAWALLGSSFLVVRTVRTTGSQVPRSTVLEAAGIKLGTPLARIDTGAIARRVERITQVQSARVTLSWPDSIVIWTRRRAAVFAVRAGKRYAAVDSYGVVLRTLASRPAGLIALQPAAGQTDWTGPGQLLRRDRSVLAAGAIVRGMPAWLRGRITTVQADGPADVILILRGGVRVRWGSPGHGSAKAREMAILLRTNATYYDVSDPATAVTGNAAHAGSGSG